MDIGAPIMFENIKIEADSDCAFFGLAAGVSSDQSCPNGSGHFGGFSSPVDNKLGTLLSSVSPFTIPHIGSNSGGLSQPIGNLGTTTNEDSLAEALFTTDITEQLELDLPEFTCDFDLLEDDGFIDANSSLLRDDSDSKDSETSHSPEAYLGSPSAMDTPPLTPPSPVVKVETETKPPSMLCSGSSSILPMLKNLPPGTNLTKILPALKTSRGRSASHDSPDVQALKRHIRMIRNRESASLSRKKKKEYVTSLEERLRELEIENLQLKQENHLLKSRLLVHQQSTTSNQHISSKNNGDSPTSGERRSPHANRTKLIAKVALLGVCCFMMLSAHVPASKNYQLKTGAISNVSTKSKVLQGYGSHPDLPLHLAEFPPTHLRLSRSLAWHEDFKEAQHKNLEFQEPDKMLKDNKTTTDRSGFDSTNRTKGAATRYYISQPRFNSHSRRRSVKSLYNNASLPLPESNDITDLPVKSNCKTAFNKTESLRVQNDLKGLFSRGKPKKKHQQPKPFFYSLMDLNSVDNNKGLTVYDQRMQRYSSFLEKIQLREDTFYVVSLAMEDHLLLSAKSSNSSSRPKMSFLMPWKNDSLGGNEEVMQIDCEVLSLKHLRKSSKI